MTKPFSPDYVSRRRPLAAYVASGALAFVVAVAAAAPPAAASTSITVTMTASSTSVEAGQSVTLTASASRNMSGTGQYLEVYDQTGGRVLVACGSGTTCTTTVTQPSASTRTYRAQAAKSTTASGVTAQSGALTVTWTDRPATDPVMVAAGDIACDPADPNFGGTSSSTCQMAATANLIKQINPSYLLPI
ncbi:MAG TPA: hypothetical protein VGZ52_10300, partial [Acidimicrobiales bacterium]|nr:hypothetical protein [Acidimicrobiales bacterium]